MAVRKDKQRRKWVADFRDAHGIRRQHFFETKEEARAHEAKERGRARQALRAEVDPRITFASFVDLALEDWRTRLTPPTIESYRATLETHYLEALGPRRMLDLVRDDVRRIVVKLANQGYKHSTIGQHLIVLSAIFTHGVATGLLAANPLRGLRKEVFGRRAMKSAARIGKVKALDRDQLQAVMSAAREESSDVRAAVSILAWAGLRQGEALALKWSDWNEEARKLDICRNLVRSLGVTTPKTDRSVRKVDVARGLASVLLAHRTTCQERALKRGERMGEWILWPEESNRSDSKTIGRLQGRIDEAVRRVGKRAGVGVVSCHMLRHTFATLLLQGGATLEWLQRQMGHASIATTNDLYARWAVLDGRSYVDDLSARTKARE